VTKRGIQQFVSFYACQRAEQFVFPVASTHTI